MKFASCIAAVFAFVIAALPASAGPKEDALKSVEAWAAAFNAGDVDKVVASFAKQPVLLGTISPGIITTVDQLREYFAASAARKSQVKIGEYQANELSETAVAFMGFYEFSRPGDGQPILNPARFTLILVKEGAEWKVAHLHSSARPKPAQ